MRYHSKCLPLGIVISLILFFQSASAQYAIPRSVFGSGGASLSSSANKLVGTLGQPFVGAMSGASNRQIAGFWHVQRYLLTSVNEKPVEALPTEYQLEQNYPNPFNPSTVIEFALPEQSQVSIKLYNVLGEEVATLVEGVEPAGFHKVQWNPERLSSGIYFYRMVAKSEASSRTFSSVKKLAYVR
ncbi:MAG: T9SS type A sorting domain-containing protein [Bacteroidota bacterium]